MHILVLAYTIFCTRSRKWNEYTNVTIA